jgi:hypothetical protein
MNQVPIMAIGCEPGYPPTLVAQVTYTLVVADPTMAGPSPGTYPLPVDGGGLDPTISTITRNSADAAVSISITEDGGTPSCGAGAQLSSPTTFGGQPGQPAPLTATTTIFAVACKHGYQSSSIAPFAYTVQ